MNIFEIYLDKIKKLVIKLNKENIIEIPEPLNGINVDVPPSQFDCHISTNVAMVLSKLNKKSPIDLANQLSELIKNNKGKKIIKKLFDRINNNPKKYLNKDQLKLDKHRATADFISGMTDRYAISLYNKIK